MNAEALGRSLSCPNTPLFSPLLGTWADDTEKYFPEFQYSGSGGTPHLGCIDRPTAPHLDEEFPATPLSPALDMYDASSPLAGGTDDEDDDTMSNHSFFSNPHSIGKSQHSVAPKDTEQKEETPLEFGAALGGQEAKRADGLDVNHRTAETRSLTAGPSLMLSPSGEPSEAKLLVEEQQAQHPPLLTNGITLHSNLRHSQDTVHPFPSISSSLQGLDQENFAAAFAQTFQAETSPQKFSIQASAEKAEMFSPFDHNSRAHPQPPPPHPDGSLHMQSPNTSPSRSANTSFSRIHMAGTSPTQRSPPHTSRPPATQGHTTLTVPASGPNAAPSLFPKAGNAGAMHFPPSNSHPLHALATLSGSLTPSTQAPTPAPAPAPISNPPPAYPVPNPQLSIQANPPFAPPQAFPGSAPNSYIPHPAGAATTPFGISPMHLPPGPGPHPFTCSPPSIAQTLNQALKNTNHHPPKAHGSLAYAANDAKEPPACMASTSPPAKPFVPDAASLVSVGNPTFIAGRNNNCTIFIAPGQPLPAHNAAAMPHQSQASKSPSPSKSPPMGSQGLGATSAALALQPDNVFLGPPAPPHPAVSPSMSPGMMPSPMITIVPNTLTPAAPTPAHGARQGKSARTGAGRQFMNEFEMQLTETTIIYLEDETINPFRGSVPVERIQNVVRSKHADLYNTVVGTRHNSWRRYVERHPDVFHLFSVEDGKWRMRLVQHENWEEGDRLEQVERQSKEQHLISCLSLFLERRQGMNCKVDEFMEAYPTLPPNQGLLDIESTHPLPARGDLVRFVRRHSCFFVYDPDTLSLSLKTDLG
eukprot:GGOE01008201.1.p1 GENE.GGOE01008201.1~~GGOE01008201.1.p1  ORF type:complete len:897 (-),score=110.54 GGOE01008201.1:631-3066(-)